MIGILVDSDADKSLVVEGITSRVDNADVDESQVVGWVTSHCDNNERLSVSNKDSKIAVDFLGRVNERACLWINWKNEIQQV